MMSLHSQNVAIVLNLIFVIRGHLSRAFTEGIPFQPQSTNCYLWLRITDLTDVSAINVCKTGGIVKAQSEVHGGIPPARLIQP